VLLAFLAFVVLLAGFVAYSADNIARRAGRRHLRLFGLRPKTTALIVAVAAGMLISLASMLAFFALNRQAIRNIEQADLLRAELTGLKRDVKTAQTDLKSARAERDSANTRAEQARQANAEANTDLGKAQQDLKTAAAATEALTTQAQALQTRVSRLTVLRTELEAQALSNQKALTASQAALSLASSRAADLDTRLLDVQKQITQLDSQNAQALAQVEAAKTQAKAAQAQAKASQLNADQSQTKANQAQGRVNVLQTQIGKLDSTRQSVTLQRNQAQAQLSSLTLQRDAVRKDLSALRLTVASLQNQSAALKNDNEKLRTNLISSQADVRYLTDEYSRASSELSASRNTVLSYSKNSLVHSGVVPSVRNLDTFLQLANSAALARGARGNPAVKLAPASRQVLETTLRGLNASTFVLCRANGNTAAGFAVDLSCDARPNTLLYSHNSVIRQATINLKGTDEVLRGQLQDLFGDAVLDLTSRGVPLENVLNGGLNSASLYRLLTRLAAKGGGSAVVGVMPRGDVKPSSQVDLYADIVQ
jgi:uncharacterized protein (DUF3084 family)